MVRLNKHTILLMLMASISTSTKLLNPTYRPTLIIVQGLLSGYSDWLRVNKAPVFHTATVRLALLRLASRFNSEMLIHNRHKKP